MSISPSILMLIGVWLFKKAIFLQGILTKDSNLSFLQLKKTTHLSEALLNMFVCCAPSVQPPQGLHIASVMKQCSGYVTCCNSYESILYPPFNIPYITIKDVLKEPRIWHKRDQCRYVVRGKTYLHCL
jgi:hypothetical protein